MANDSKAKTAKERLAQAKRDAEDAELVSPAVEKALDEASGVTDDGTTPEPSSGEGTADVDAVDGDTLTGDTVDSDTAIGEDTVAADDVITDTLEGGDGDDTLAGGAGADSPETDAFDKPILDAGTESGAQDSAAHDDHGAHDDHHEETSSFASTALKYLVILLIGMGVALWAAPRLAPHLPASIAAWVAPAASIDAETEARLAEMIAAETADIRSATEAAEARAESAAADLEALSARLDQSIDAVRADLSGEIGDMAQTRGAAADRIENVSERIAAAEATITGLRTEIDSLSGFAADADQPGAATLERVAAFGAAVEGLRSEVSALSERASEIEAAAQAADVEALDARVTALEGGEAATASARTEAEDIVRQANIDAALTRVSQSLVAGRAFDAPLNELTSLSGVAAPQSLAAVASGGAPTLVSLTRTFPTAAQAAYAADLKANAGEGMLDGVLASVQGRIGGRPSVETPGDDIGAILSRMEARLSEGALTAAQAEAEALSPEANAAMGAWLGQLDQSVAAKDGLDEMRSALNSK